MRNFLVLVVLLICFAAYMRDQRPAVWNSWMADLGANNFAVGPNLAPSATPDASSNAGTSTAPATTTPAAPSAPAAVPPTPAPAPVRQVPAGGLIRNGNFADDGMDWEGDGRPDPSGKGLDVTLSPSAWTRVYQTFPGNSGTRHSIEVTYRLSPGLTVSRNAADYANMGKSIRVSGFENYGAIAFPPGNFYGTIGDPNAATICCEVYAPQFGSTDVQDYQHTYPAIPPNGNNTFALAFPPGTGTVTLLTAYVTSQ
jgi:hypothetical protein